MKRTATCILKRFNEHLEASRSITKHLEALGYLEVHLDASPNECTSFVSSPRPIVWQMADVRLRHTFTNML